MSWSPLSSLVDSLDFLVDNVAYDFVLTSTALPNMYRSSYLHSLWDGRQVAVELVFCGLVMFSEFVKKSILHSYVVTE